MTASDGRTHRRATRLSLAFALLVVVTLPAHADFRVCNKTHALINIAVGTDAGEAFRTEGWWVATPGSCATPVRGPLKSRFVYLYATDIDGVDLVTGTTTMCIDRGKFVAYRRGQLLATRLAGRHLRRDRHARFRRLDDVPHRSAEVTITSPSSAPRSPRRTGGPAAGSGNRASRDSAPARADKARARRLSLLHMRRDRIDKRDRRGARRRRLSGRACIASLGALDKLFTGTVNAPSGPTNTRAASACGGARSFITS